MKRINYIKSIGQFALGICFIASIQSCSSEVQTGEREALDQAKEQLRNLPELEKEIKEHKSKVNAQQISGTFTGSVDGESFEFDEWQGDRSRITFFDASGVIYANISSKPLELLTIKITADNWSQRQTPYEIPASLYSMDGSEYMDISYSKKDSNGDPVMQFSSAEGKLVIHQFDDNKVKISFEGEGFKGDIRKQERAPLSFEIDLDYNFITSDQRSSKQS